MEGFQCLLLVFSSNSGKSSKSKHTIYCKKHVVRQSAQATPNRRTLFTLGWPPYSKDEAIEELFSRAGHVTAVYLQASPGPVDLSRDAEDRGSFKVGYVVFASESDVDSALRLCHTPVPISCVVPAAGLGKWSHEYLLQRRARTLLEMDAEVGMALYDRQQEEAEKVRANAGQPDEEGWITVTRKTRRVVNPEPSKRQSKKKKKEQLGLRVYPWQQRESQREQVAELRRKFEEDKQRVALMREKRKFKPY